MDWNRRAVLACVAVSMLVAGPSTATAATSEDWIARSDANTQRVTELFASYLPEIMSSLGVEGFDEEIQQISREIDQEADQKERELLADLQQRLAMEEHPAVRQDLEILIDVLDRDLRLNELEDRLMLPYFDIAETVFRGLRGLLDVQVPAERRAAALVRLRRYAGLEEGYTPLTQQAEAYIRDGLAELELLGPYAEEVEKDLARAPRLTAGIGQMFDAVGVSGFEPSLVALEAQLERYHAFLKQEVLPRTRNDYRMPAELYVLQLEDAGVDMPVPELSSRAKTAFREIQNEMQTLARIVAQERELPSDNYRAVLRELKKSQLDADSIVDFYNARIKEVEALIERERVTTLPKRGMRLRLATEAEEAVVQAATIRWPQLLGEAAEVGEIILPVRRVSTDGSEDTRIDDFTFEAAAWSLIVHEGRPGHELQMASILEQGLSKARAFYAFNSTNIEGWALYAEAEMKPYLPIDAQLVSLQHRLLRAARAYLDPGLQLGEITPEEAMRVLVDDVVVSVPLAEQEVERYTSRSPGQATSYFCGYSRLLELRTDAERILGEAFDRQAFNDFILSQGLIPPALLRRAVMDEFAAAQSEDNPVRGHPL